METVFNDLNFLLTKNCSGAQAKGAQFSWSRDKVAANDQWSAKGAIAGQVVWIGNPTVGQEEKAYLNLIAFAPTVTFQRVTNTNTIKAAQNAKVLTYGFSSEALFNHYASHDVD